MVKTRLDEIVEEELAAVTRLAQSPEGIELMMRIADASFRHGVEQSYAHNRVVGGPQDCVSMDLVQPAPSGTHPWKLDFERRKGQRRKGTEVYSTVYELESSHYKPIFQTLPNCPWYFNRRSGNDRRKS